MNNISHNLRCETRLRERNRLSRLDRKIDEIAAFEDPLLRARSRKHDFGKLKSFMLTLTLNDSRVNPISDGRGVQHPPTINWPLNPKNGLQNILNFVTFPYLMFNMTFLKNKNKWSKKIVFSP